MVTTAYRVAERFAPEWEAWPNYIKRSGLAHLHEVVGLDVSLCPPVFGPLAGDDWDHLVFGQELSDCFDDLEYLPRRTSSLFDVRRHQILAVAREASDSDVQSVALEGFCFKGFELIEEATSISALTNCGAFKGAFEPSDLSTFGLVPLASRACEIRDALASMYPDESHADCAVWAIWRRETA